MCAFRGALYYLLRNILYWSCGGLVVATRKGCPPPEGESYYNVGGGAPLPGGAGPSLSLPPRNLYYIGQRGIRWSHDNLYGPTWSRSDPNGVPCGPTRKKQWSHVVPEWSQRCSVWSQLIIPMAPRGPGVRLSFREGQLSCPLQLE